MAFSISAAHAFVTRNMLSFTIGHDYYAAIKHTAVNSFQHCIRRRGRTGVRCPLCATVHYENFFSCYSTLRERVFEWT